MPHHYLQACMAHCNLSIIHPSKASLLTTRDNPPSNPPWPTGWRVLTGPGGDGQAQVLPLSSEHGGRRSAAPPARSGVGGSAGRGGRRLAAAFGPPFPACASRARQKRRPSFASWADLPTRCDFAGRASGVLGTNKTRIKISSPLSDDSMTNAKANTLNLYLKSGLIAAQSSGKVFLCGKLGDIRRISMRGIFGISSRLVYLSLSLSPLSLTLSLLLSLSHSHSLSLSRTHTLSLSLLLIAHMQCAL